MTSPAGQDDLRGGAINAVLAAAAFAGVGACIKAASAHASTEMVVFFRNSVALIFLLPWLLRVRLSGLRTDKLGGHLLRTLFGLSAMYCFFYALHHLHLAHAVLLNYSSPLFIPLIAWLWIREKPPVIIVPVTVLGLVGITLIVKPDDATLPALPALVGILSGILAAAAMVSIRRVARTEPTPRIVFYFSAFSTIISAIPLAWAWQTPDPVTLGLMVTGGALALVGQLCLTKAYALAPAARVGAMTYISVVFAGLLGWILWSETPDLLAVIGAVTVVLACVLATWQHKPRAVAAKP